MWIVRSKKYNGGRISPLISHAPIVEEDQAPEVEEMPQDSDIKESTYHEEHRKV
jgi:hypothetical protein